MGVPQSSVLGPLLFCIYVNDLREILDERTIKHIFYADDLQINLHSTKDKILEGILRLSDAAQMVSEWAGNLSLRLNAGKTEAIVFGCRKNINDINSLGLAGIGTQNGVLIPISSEVVSLSVTLDSSLRGNGMLTKLLRK